LRFGEIFLYYQWFTNYFAAIHSYSQSILFDMKVKSTAKA